MPRTSISINEKYNNLLSATIIKYMNLRSVDVPELALATRICKVTIYKRLQSPEKFSVQELRRVVRKLQIPRDEIAPALLGADVA